LSFVLDASATLAAFLPDERNGFAVELVRRLVSERATVPALWAAEIANSLHMARRRGRIDDAFVAVALEDLLGLPLDVDRDDPRKRMSTHLRMAKQLGLTVYDVIHLELASRLQLPLATCDKRLSAAAKRTGVALVAP